jgi:hypothetical protein
MATPVPPVFTLEAVNALVPKLNTIVGRQLERRADIESRLKTLCELTGEVPENLGPRADDAPPVLDLKRELVHRVEEYQGGWHELEELGAVLKDPRIGLLDFYGRVDGKLVWLCWKFGEEEGSYYHALDEGFSGRKAIGQSVKQRLLN